MSENQPSQIALIQKLLDDRDKLYQQVKEAQARVAELTDKDASCKAYEASIAAKDADLKVKDAEISRLGAVIGEKDEKIQKLISQLEYLKRKLWGKMSEKSSLPNDPRQLEIDFGEVKLTEEEKNAAKAAAQEVEADREARKVTVRSYEKYGTLNQVIRNLAVDVLNDMADDNLDHEAVKQKRPNKKLSK